MSSPLVSILTPTFNHESYIAQCIESVLAQDYAQWELIILDDGSRDSTASIAAKYAYFDPRIRLLTQEHKGPHYLAQLYNKGLSASKGELIAILEGDDYWPHYKLRQQVESFSKDAALSFGMCEVVDDSTSTLFFIAPHRRLSSHVINNTIPGSAISAFLRQDNFIPAVTVLIRRHALESIGGFRAGDSMLQVDFSTWCHLCLRYQFQYTAEIYGYWRRHRQSITVSRAKQVALSKNDFLRHFISQVDSCHLAAANISPDEIDTILGSNLEHSRLLASQAFQWLLVHGYKEARQLYFESACNAPNLQRLYKALGGLVLSCLRIHPQRLPFSRSKTW